MFLIVNLLLIENMYNMLFYKQVFTIYKCRILYYKYRNSPLFKDCILLNKEFRTSQKRSENFLLGIAFKTIAVVGILSH